MTKKIKKKNNKKNLVDAGCQKKRGEIWPTLGCQNLAATYIAALQTEIQHSLEDHKFIGRSKKEKQQHMT